MEHHEIKKTVRKAYARIASTGCGCGCSNLSKDEISKQIGYSEDEINHVQEANLGLGCGNPTALAEITEGDTVLDLGSGAGFDAFLAAKKVGSTGKVIGVDMTPEMITKARKNAKKSGYTNAEFRLGDIEDLPVEDRSIDVIISNCVINLAPDKDKVFREAYRVLKDNGRMVASDIVLLKKLSKKQATDPQLICGCVGGALLKKDYLAKLKKAGFVVKILHEDRDISETQYNRIALESLKFMAKKVKASQKPGGGSG